MDLTLESAGLGCPLRVRDVCGGKDVRARLASMGLLPGVVLEVIVRGPLGGPVLVQVDGTRLALGRALARKVLVEP